MSAEKDRTSRFGIALAVALAGSMLIVVVVLTYALGSIQAFV
jgi:hypothetical protein